MRIKLRIVLCIALLLMLCACAGNPAGQSGGHTEPSTNPVRQEGVRLDDVSLREFQALIEIAGDKNCENWWYNMALTAGEFSNPRKLDLHVFFYNGFKTAGVTDEEESMLYELGFPPEMDIQKNPREDMDQILQAYLGLSLEETDRVGLDKMTYVESTDAYYKYSGDFSCKEGVTVRDGYVLEDGSVCLYYTSNNEWEGEWVLTLKPSGVEDGPAYHIVSNLPA